MIKIEYDLDECLEILAEKYYMFRKSYIKMEMEFINENIQEWIEDGLYSDEYILDNDYFINEFDLRMEHYFRFWSS